MKYDVLSFGDALLRTQDLDPVYVAMHNANLYGATRLRLCLAYWCFYHLGVAARLAEETKAQDFWNLMKVAARNQGPLVNGLKPWPRGAERRHFRGLNALAAVQSLTEKYSSPEEAATYIALADGVPRTFRDVSKSVQRHVGFGPWMAFKIADMAERVLGQSVDFSDCELALYRDPRQGAALAYQEQFAGQLCARPWEYAATDLEVTKTVNYLVAYWRKKRAKAPPGKDRLINVQEVETILCKYKSHYKGHYPMGKDTAECYEGLNGWGDLARQLQKGLP